MPAIVKAWFDSVMQKGVTFRNETDGQIAISNAGKKALTLISSAGVYSNKSSSNREHALSLSNLEFQYMGYSDVRGILAEGMEMSEETKQINLNKSICQVQEIAKEWYRKEGYENLMCINHNNRKAKLDKTR
jgi:FMN-dependent NADH-azoreductase